MTYEEFLSEWRSPSSVVEVRTSGSTGVPKRMSVEKSRMMASARMTCDFLGLKSGDKALLCMSVDYIAGKMMVVRAVERGLNLSVVRPSNHPLAGITEPFDFVAMVPSQVYESLRVPEEAALLVRTKNLIIGGGAISRELQMALDSCLSESGRKDWRVFSTYGMTETLSHIALRKIVGEGASGWYTPFDGVEVSLSPEGCLVIDAPYVCREPLVTNDIAEIRDGRFRILGRKDNVICTGGIKVQTEEVEALLSPHLDAPFAITKKPDRKFGEAIVLLSESGDMDNLRRICKEVLPAYWVPKHYLHTSHIPMTPTGKPARKEIEKICLNEE